MTQFDTETWAASREFGLPKRTARVDPAKTLSLIKRIQSATGALPAPQQQAAPPPQIFARAG
ncbi:MAG: hypothetical protein AAFQ64_15050 [Pseudomonadota bacterium]